MKNILGTTENLELFKKGRKVYEFKNSNGYSYESTFDSNGNELTFKNSNGYSYESTFDSNGNELTFKNSNGETRGFDIPKYTMEKQTAVEWLEGEINNRGPKENNPPQWLKDLYEQAKEMEKQQIMDAFGKERIVKNGEGYFKVFNSKQYYNETFKSEK